MAKAGRPKKSVDLDSVHILRSFRFSFNKISNKLGISRNTLFRAIKDDSDRCPHCVGIYTLNNSLGILAQVKNRLSKPKIALSPEVEQKPPNKQRVGL